MILTIIDKILKIIFFIPVVIILIVWNHIIYPKDLQYDTLEVLEYWWKKPVE
jgi:hypothetical protein